MIWLLFSILLAFLGSWIGSFIGMGRHSYKDFTTLHAFSYTYFGGLIATLPLLILKLGGWV